VDFAATAARRVSWRLSACCTIGSRRYAGFPTRNFRHLEMKRARKMHHG
jgi:hypothetical protein